MTLATNRQGQSNGSSLESKGETSLADSDIGAFDIDLSITVRDVRELLMETLKSAPELLRRCVKSSRGIAVLVGYNVVKLAGACGVTWVVTESQEATTNMAVFTLVTSKSAWILAGSLGHDSVKRVRRAFYPN